MTALKKFRQFAMTQDYFALFGLESALFPDMEQLESRYRALSVACHPDTAAGKSAFEQKQAAMMSAALNEAYRCLKNPLTRAAYLLRQKGAWADDERHTAFAPDFLMQQMDWRERLDNALRQNDAAAAARLRSEVDAAYRAALAQIEKDYSAGNWAQAAQQVRCGQFIEKMQQQLAEAEV